MAGGQDARRRRKAMIVAALGGECVKCGDRRMAVLTLHHRHPDMKRRTIERNFKPWRRPMTPKVWAEVWLCDLMCATCHMLEGATVIGETECWEWLR
jgi:hypothetical protein